jgi:SpoVK/Ycf46/Vps4 family AAA+-type ATPase
LQEGIDLDALAQQMEGMSGADIKYICDRAATIPFLRSVATGAEGPITDEILADVITTTPRSVTTEMLKRFEEWGRQAATA